MSRRNAGVAVLAVQLLLVMSIAAKYAWERHHYPRVWARTAQIDPNLPLRGRYLALHLAVDACELRNGEAAQDFGVNAKQQWASFKAQRWNVRLAAKDGKLIAVPSDAASPDSQTLLLRNSGSCAMAGVGESTEFFISERAKVPVPLKPGEDLWAEVTVPRSGPPRPIQLAVSDGKQFRVLDLK